MSVSYDQPNKLVSGGPRPARARAASAELQSLGQPVVPTNLSIAIAKSAKLLDLRGDYDKAASILIETLDSPEAADHPDEVLEALAFLSEIQLSQGKPMSALKSAERALQMEARVGTTDRSSPHLRTARGVLVSCRGKMLEMKET